MAILCCCVLNQVKCSVLFNTPQHIRGVKHFSKPAVIKFDDRICGDLRLALLLQLNAISLLISNLSFHGYTSYCTNTHSEYSIHRYATLKHHSTQVSILPVDPQEGRSSRHQKHMQEKGVPLTLGSKLYQWYNSKYNRNPQSTIHMQLK